MDRALIVQKYWCDKIFDENKTWEMRSSKTKVRGCIGIIESGSGLIVGETNLVDCMPEPIPRTREFFDKHKVDNLNLLEKWRFAWVLKDSKRYDEPIPYKHPRGAVIWVKI